jgi:hypothetical protein
MEHTESDTNTPRADGGETNHTTSEDEADETTGPIEFNVTIEDGTTVIEMDGDRDTAVIVQSASGERVYLPPEDFERAAPTAQRNESPYQSSGTTARINLQRLTVHISQRQLIVHINLRGLTVHISLHSHNQMKKGLSRQQRAIASITLNQQQMCESFDKSLLVTHVSLDSGYSIELYSASVSSTTSSQVMGSYSGLPSSVNPRSMPLAIDCDSAATSITQSLGRTSFTPLSVATT